MAGRPLSQSIVSKQLRMKTHSSGHARNSFPVFFADVYTPYQNAVRGGWRASNEVWSEIWAGRRPRGPTSSFGTRSNAWKPRTSRPSARTFSVSHYKSALGYSVAGPIRPTKWLSAPDRVHRGLKCRPWTTSCLRPCGIKPPQTRWLDSSPRPTAMPMALDAFAALLLHIEPQPPSRRRVYGRLMILPHLCKREGSVLARRRTRAGHVVDRGIWI